jgi:hypothetical protein
MTNSGSAEAAVELRPIDRVLMPCSNHYQIEQLPQLYTLTQIAFMIERVMNDVMSGGPGRVRQSDARPPDRHWPGISVKLCGGDDVFAAPV